MGKFGDSAKVVLKVFSDISGFKANLRAIGEVLLDFGHS